MDGLNSMAGWLAAAQPDAFTRLMLRRPGATPLAQETDELYMWLFWFCVAWFVLLMGLMAYFVIAYRRRRGRIAPRSASHNTPLEVTWTLIPTALVIYIFWMGFDGYMRKVVAPGDAVEMRLTGFKWSWSLVYPNGGETSVTTTLGAREIPVFYMPAEKNIRLRMNSSDVMHAFWVPDFRIKADLLPNRYTSVWFRAGAPTGATRHAMDSNEAQGRNRPFVPGMEGVAYEDHWVFCAEYCGTEHSEMAAIIRVVPESDFNRWVESVAGGNMTPIQIGEQQWKQKCASCHTIDGRSNTGPTWKNVFGHEVEFTDGTKYTAEQMSDPTFFANYIVESIRVPGAKIVKGYPNNMTPWPASQLSDTQIDGIIQYMMSPALTDKAPPSLPSGTAPAAAPEAGAGGQN
jgi:cytochrome c oxidase subunit 2